MATDEVKKPSIHQHIEGAAVKSFFIKEFPQNWDLKRSNNFIQTPVTDKEPEFLYDALLTGFSAGLGHLPLAGVEWGPEAQPSASTLADVPLRVEITKQEEKKPVDPRETGMGIPREELKVSDLDPRLTDEYGFVHAVEVATLPAADALAYRIALIGEKYMQLANELAKQKPDVTWQA